jgi:hypothetical protein
MTGSICEVPKSQDAQQHSGACDSTYKFLQQLWRQRREQISADIEPSEQTVKEPGTNARTIARHQLPKGSSPEQVSAYADAINFFNQNRDKVEPDGSFKKGATLSLPGRNARGFFTSRKNADGDTERTYSDGTHTVAFVQNDGVNLSGRGEINTPNGHYQVVDEGEVIADLPNVDKSKSNADLLKEAVLQLAAELPRGRASFEKLSPFIQRVIVSTYGEAKGSGQDRVAAVRGFLGELETSMNHAPSPQPGVNVNIKLITDEPSHPHPVLEVTITNPKGKSTLTGPIHFGNPSGGQPGTTRRLSREAEFYSSDPFANSIYPTQ